jgi:hypothetical protein
MLRLLRSPYVLMTKKPAMTEMGFRTAHTVVTTYKLDINIVTTEKLCFRTEQISQDK